MLNKNDQMTKTKRHLDGKLKINKLHSRNSIVKCLKYEYSI